MSDRYYRRASEPIINQSVDHLINQPINQSINPTITRRLTGDSHSLLYGIHTPESSINQPINQLTNQSIDQEDEKSPMSDHLVTIPLTDYEERSINPSITQPINQPFNQAVNQSDGRHLSNQPTNRSIDQPIDKSTIHSTNRSIGLSDIQSDRSASTSIIQSTENSINQPANESLAHSANTSNNNTDLSADLSNQSINPSADVSNQSTNEPMIQSTSRLMTRRPSLNVLGHPDHPSINPSCGPDDVIAELQHEHPEQNALVTIHYTHPATDQSTNQSSDQSINQSNKHYHITPLDPTRTWNLTDALLSLRGLGNLATPRPSTSSTRRPSYGSGHSIEPGHSHGPARQPSFSRRPSFTSLTKPLAAPAAPTSDALHETSSRADLSKVDDDILTTDPRIGLTDEQVANRFARFGLNEITETKPNPLKKFLSYFTGSIAYLIEFAAILSAVLKDWLDFAIITALLLINALIGFCEESRAESAVAALKSTLALRSRVKRNGKMVETEAKNIVPGDVISLRTGDVISADCVVLPQVKKRQVWKGVARTAEEQAQIQESPSELKQGNEDDDWEEDELVELTVDQSALTGESLPSRKHPYDLLYSSSIIKSGNAQALVIKTGERTFVGRAANLISITNEVGQFQRIIEKIGNFLVLITVGMVGILLVIGCTIQGYSFVKQLHDCLVIAIAAIPVGLPSVMSAVMAVGSRHLASKNVIVKRLTAVEEMAGVTVLCSDKTGTLSQNLLQMDTPYLPPERSLNEVLWYGFLASEHATKDAIDICLREAACASVPELQGLSASSAETPGYRVLKHVPFTSTTKLATTTLKSIQTNEQFIVAKGAPQVILSMCRNADHAKADAAIIDMAKKGLRALGVARSASFQGRAPADLTTLTWELVGIVSLLDPPRPDSKETIRRCAEYGLSVKMITGDQLLIAKEVARRLGLGRCILSPAIIQNSVDHGGRSIDETRLIEMCQKCDGFAQVVPEDKYRCVELLQKGGATVSMTGDGVNDSPALKKANVGIAVHGCTDAARAAASIVLLEPGLSTIVDGIMTSRAIFQRMRSYALYRITSTIHFLIFLFIAILAFNFRIPAILIVLITVMNDAATLVISVDNAVISKQPDKWRIGQLIFLSFVLAVLLAAASFVHFFVFRDALGFSDAELATVMYLQLSSCPHFVIFSTRVPGPFWERAPSCLFFWAVMGTQIIAMFFAIYGVVSAAIGWPASVAIMCISLLYFMVLDQVKLFVYRIWSYKLTVMMWPTKKRREVLKEKIRKAAVHERYIERCKQARRVMNACKFVLLVKQSQLNQINIDKSEHISNNADINGQLKDMKNINKYNENDKHEKIKFQDGDNHSNSTHAEDEMNHRSNYPPITNEDIELAQWP